MPSKNILCQSGCVKIRIMLAKILISPNLEDRVEEINKILDQSELTLNHPDLLYFPSNTKLGIEQAKVIIDHFSIKPYSAKGRAVILEDATSLTDQAQNALLKTLEEPPEEAILILGVNSSEKLLPTILSRCQISIIPDVSTQPTPGVGYVDTYGEGIRKLLTQDIALRFEYIEKLKDQKMREQFLKALVNYFHQDLNIHPKGVNTDFIKELLQAEEWAENNVYIRGILEYLMLKMPKVV